MFRFETFVKGLVCTSLLLFTAASTANKDDKKDEKPKGSDRAWDRYLDLGCAGQEEPNLECRNLAKLLPNSGTADSCKESKKEFDKALTEFTNACGALGMKSTTKAGSLGCSFQMERCGCLSEEGTNDDSFFECSSVDKDSSDDSPSDSISNNRLIDLTKAEQEMTYCPDKALADAEVKKDLENAEKRLKDNKEKLKKVTEEMEKLAKDRADKAEKLAKQQTDAEKERDKAIRELQRNMKEKDRQILDEIAKVQAEIEGSKDSISQLSIEKKNLVVKHEEAKTQINLECYGSAIDSVRKEQEARAQKSSGGMNALIRSQGGLTDRKYWQGRAKYYYDECMKSSVAQAKRRAADNYRENALDVAEESLRRHYNRISLLNKQLSEIKGSHPCGTPGVAETKACANFSEAAQDLQHINNDFAKTAQSLRNEAARHEAVANESYMNKMKEYAELQKQVEKDQQTVDNLEKYVALKTNKLGRGGGPKAAEAAAKLHSSYSSLKTSTVSYIEDCCADGNKVGKCGVARNFNNYLNKYVHPSPSEVLDHFEHKPKGRDPAPTPAPTPSRPPTRTTTPGSAI